MTEPPSGAPPPATASLRDGRTVDLRALAERICARYRAEFPDEHERYGDAGMAWCVHDNQYIVNWAVIEASGYGGFERQLAWLAGILETRDFPLERLARNLEIGAEVAREQVGGARGDGLAAAMAGGAAFVRSKPTFLD